MMAKFVLILYVPGIPALSMSDIDFDFGGVWPKEIIKSNRDCLYVLVRNVTLLYYYVKGVCGAGGHDDLTVLSDHKIKELRCC